MDHDFVFSPQVKVNGLFSPKFLIGNSTRHGYPLLPPSFRACFRIIATLYTGESRYQRAKSEILTIVFPPPLVSSLQAAVPYTWATSFLKYLGIQLTDQFETL